VIKRIQWFVPGLLVLGALTSGVTGCSKGAGNTPEAAAAPLLVSHEDVLVVRNSALTSGPSITGSVEPERRADLRAEVPAVVLAVLKENGDPVE
jgi:multidrug efflux pump subunit AcrA (membrane-fusion protein)